MSVLNDNIIEINGLSIQFKLRVGTVHAVNNASLKVKKGKITALVGESGSGKSTLASAILRIIPIPGEIVSGNILFDGSKDITGLNADELQRYRWMDVSMVFQAAQSALNPVMTIKEQIIETFKAHIPDAKEETILQKAVELLNSVRLEPDRVLNAYPHELSGGMKQRVMIVFSLLLDPKLIILDEPTTALDVITQEYIFEILIQLYKKLDLSMMLLTHDIAVVAKVADIVGVMYAGTIVETGDVYDVFKSPAHPYTKQLLSSVPSLLDDVKPYNPIRGTALDLFKLPEGCPFVNRCPEVRNTCRMIKPVDFELGNQHRVCCHKYNNEVYRKEAQL